MERAGGGFRLGKQSSRSPTTNTSSERRQDGHMPTGIRTSVHRHCACGNAGRQLWERHDYVCALGHDCIFPGIPKITRCLMVVPRVVRCIECTHSSWHAGVSLDEESSILMLGNSGVRYPHQQRAQSAWVWTPTISLRHVHLSTRKGASSRLNLRDELPQSNSGTCYRSHQSMRRHRQQTSREARL